MSMVCSGARDPRLDCLRGFALLIVILDHIQGNPVREVTPGRLGLSDMAEVFVFLSGLVCGLSYQRRIDADGFWPCQRRALVRSLQLYCSNILFVAIFAAIIIAWNESFPRFLYEREPHQGSFVPFSFERIGPSVLALRFEPVVFCVLPLYMAMLLALPSLLMLRRLGALVVPCLSVGLYLMVQGFPETVWLVPKVLRQLVS